MWQFAQLPKVVATMPHSKIARLSGMEHAKAAKGSPFEHCCGRTVLPDAEERAEHVAKLEKYEHLKKVHGLY